MTSLDVDIRASAPDLDLAFRTDALVTGVVGASGAGKTSLLLAVAGLRRPAAGRITLGDDVLFDATARIDVPVHRRRLGVVFQDDRLFPHLSVRANLLYGAPRDAADEGTPITLANIVDLLDLGSLVDRRTHHLSGGERQRVALGRALLARPRLLLLDEPASSLDRQRRHDLLRLVRAVRDDLAVPMLYVSHDLAEVLQLTDRLLVVDGGRALAHGPLAEVVRAGDAWRTIRSLGTMNVLALHVLDHDEAAGLTRFRVGPDGAATVTLVGPLVDRDPGAVLRAAIRPEDIAFAVQPVEGISIRNQVPAAVTEVTAHADRSLVTVALAAGTTLLVEVSHKTVREMALAEGTAVWCLIKSNALTYAG
jgi:molybdate transport system ATP-binding protein